MHRRFQVAPAARPRRLSGTGTLACAPFANDRSVYSVPPISSKRAPPALLTFPQRLRLTNRSHNGRTMQVPVAKPHTVGEHMRNQTFWRRPQAAVAALALAATLGGVGFASAQHLEHLHALSLKL